MAPFAIFCRQSIATMVYWPCLDFFVTCAGWDVCSPRSLVWIGILDVFATVLNAQLAGVLDDSIFETMACRESIRFGERHLK